MFIKRLAKKLLHFYEFQNENDSLNILLITPYFYHEGDDGFFVAKALIKLGCIVSIFDYRMYAYTFGKRKMNEMLRDVGEVDATIIMKGELLDRSVVERMKNTVLIFPDHISRFSNIFYKLAEVCDYVYTLSCEDVEGLDNVEWLPLGCDPDIHRPRELSDAERQYYGSDLVFVGTCHSKERLKWIRMFKSFDIKIWGNNWPKNLRGYMGRPAYFSELARVYSASKIALNKHFHPYGVNQRCIEATACGILLLTDNVVGVSELFEPGKEIVTYDSDEEAVELATYYLEHSEEREAIARKGMEKARNYSYYKQLSKVLSRLRM